MRNSQLEKLLDRMAAVIPPQLRREGEAINSCIISTRLACGVLRNSGVPVEPLACRLIAMNEPYYEATLRLGRPPTSAAETGEGAWSVEVGQPGFPGPGWNGHLVALVKRRYLLDLSVQQVQRPTKGIYAEAFWTVVSPEFVRGEDPAAFQEPDSGTRLIYYAQPGEQSFLNAPAWRDFRVRGDLDHFVIERFRPRQKASVPPAV